MTGSAPDHTKENNRGIKSEKRITNYTRIKGKRITDE